MAVAAVTSAISAGALLAARRRRLAPAVAATAAQMALVLVYWGTDGALFRSPS
jgi:hypothetical protein